MQGEILSYNDATGAGLISGDDAQRYSFTRDQLQQLAPIAAGMRVDFEPREGIATGIFLIRRPASPTLVAPIHPGPDGLNAWGYFKLCMKKYVDGNGRARRSEYWYFVLFQLLILLVPFVLGMIFALVGSDGDSEPLTVVGGLILIVTGIAYLGFLLPGIAVMIRRFHDVGLTGWLILLGLIPYVGGLITLVITVLPSESRANKHGPVPGTTARTIGDVFS